MTHMMDDFPLLMSSLYDRAVSLFPRQEIVSVEHDRSIRRRTYAETDLRVRKLAAALLERLGVAQGGTIGTFSTGRQPTPDGSATPSTSVCFPSS
jgi:hypothetical protein